MEPVIIFLLLLVGLLSALVSAISVYENYQAASKQLKSPDSNLISTDTDSRCPKKSKRNRRKRLVFNDEEQYVSWTGLTFI
jgi:hypothetical protein